MTQIRSGLITRLAIMLLAVSFGHGAFAGEEHETRASLAGRLLVAKPNMGDPRFADAVILMVQHSADGAFGLFINKPILDVGLAEIAEGFGITDIETSETAKAHFGGPVEPSLGFVVHSSDYSSASTIKITESVAVSGDASVFRDILVGEGPQRFVFVMGYAGWSAGQLEAELARDDWEIAAVDREVVLDADYGTKWQRALRQRLIEL